MLALASLTSSGCVLLDPPRELRVGLEVLPSLPPPDQAPQVLRVVSWNIEYGQDIDRALEEILGSEHLAAADLYFFQELDLSDTRRMARELGLGGAYFAASVREGAHRILGNAVLSRWPVDRMQRVRLHHGGRWLESHRSATVVEFTIGERHLRVASTHTSTPVLSPEERLLQGRQVLDATIGAFADAWIVAGDFNTLERLDEKALHGIFRDGGFTVATLTTDSTLESWWKRWAAPHDRLDHIFVKGLEVLEAGAVTGTRASDHRPVWALLRWAPDS